MSDSILVNFHCHTSFSDGEQSPEALAANLAAAGVRYCALSDHNSLEGLPRFQEALKKRGIACVAGLELTTRYQGREAHLLAYGFDPNHAGLAATMLSLRQALEPEVHSIAGSLRKRGISRGGAHAAAAVSQALNGQIEIGQAIALIHRAGGKAFWAHPLLFEPDLARLEGCVEELKGLGLDGLEALYAPFDDAQRASLRQLARRYHLLICAGTDFHGSSGVGSAAYGIEMPRADWIEFRAAVLGASLFDPDAPDAPETAMQAAGTGGRGVARSEGVAKAHPFRRRAYIIRIFVPTLIAIGLFLGAIWGILLPSFEQTLLERKRELIHELTNSAWSILVSYESDVQAGLLTRPEAQAAAAARIAALRYGPEGKDYFWIQDMQPRMIMHPYRSDLNGQDLSDFTDPRGVAIFVEFADQVRLEGEGYIDYVWQWKDDPTRLEPKQSYIKGFEPWGWIIGTGIYTDDVETEITRLERDVSNAVLAISGAVVLLLVFVLQQSLRIERQRQEVLDSLHESTERYHTLVEATTEGTLLIVDGRCRYANPTFLEMSGYLARQVEFLDLEDLLPRTAENAPIWERARQVHGEHAREGLARDGVLQRADGTLLECVLVLNPITFAGQGGLILLARDISRAGPMLVAGGISHAAQAVAVGLFRAQLNRRATLIESNPAARAFFMASRPALADLFADPGEFEALMRALKAGEAIREHVLLVKTAGEGLKSIALAVQRVHDEREHADYLDGTLQDVTAARKKEAAHEALIEKLQASLLFLHEPIAHLGRSLLTCDPHTPIEDLARQMTARNVPAALVTDGKTALGIVTDHDLRARVLAEGVSAATRVETIMSAPLTRIPEEALVYEALMRMEESGVRHLAVEARGGQIVSVIDNKQLVQFQRYGPIVLRREIARAASPEEVARCTERTPLLVKTLLDNTARPRHVTNLLASICDATTERLVQLAMERLGPAPVPFAFLAMGSQGRQEQTLVTDQDNGIIYASPQAAEQEKVREYFLALGKFVCNGLAQAGYALCRGGVMASNPRWCRALTEWVSGFDDWIDKAEPQEIIDLGIFFDFRTVVGDADLTHELRQTIQAALRAKPAIFPLLAQNTLEFKPPMRLLGNIYLSRGATEHAGEINLKDAMMPMVAFARLYALRHQLNETHTLGRIEALAGQGVLLPASRDEIIAAYDFLMELRLQNQVTAIQAGHAPTNLIYPGKLGHIRQELLKQAFAQVTAIQKRVGYDFLGGA